VIDSPCAAHRKVPQRSLPICIALHNLISNTCEKDRVKNQL
jgi:hypothetical protein